MKGIWLLACCAWLAAEAYAADPASKYVPVEQARVFTLDFKQIAMEDRTGNIMDAGFLPPDAASLYLYQSDIIKPALQAYDLAKGSIRDLDPLVPPEKVPLTISWAPDGSRLAFMDETELDLISVKDGSRRVLKTDPWRFGDIYWQDQGHVLAGCDDRPKHDYEVCSLDLVTAKITVFDIDHLARGLPSTQGYFSDKQSFLVDFFGPESGSAVLMVHIGADGQLRPTRIRFPELDAESPISATADARYMATTTLIHVGDPREGKMRVVLLIGNVATGYWARIEPSPPMGENIYPKLSPDGQWLEVLAMPDNGAEDQTRLYLVAIPKELRDYLDSHP